MTLTALFSAGSSWLLLRTIMPQFNALLLDHPNSRSSHCQPTPRGGGLVFVALSSVSSGIVLLGAQDFTISALILLAFPLAIVGFLDDYSNLPVPLRYGVQLFTAALMIGFSPLVRTFILNFVTQPWIIVPVLIFLVIGLTSIVNFVNFMDGLDGLVAGCLVVSISALAIVLEASWPVWVLVGSLLGFLMWNWSPAKVFMGDVGSTFLGAVFAGLLLQSSSWPALMGCLLVATPLLADACTCVPRRLLNGQRVFQPHRLHLYQRLNQAGWSHSRVSSTYIAATALLALAMLAGGLPWVFGLAVAELLLGVWLDQYVAVPFALASKI